MTGSLVPGTFRLSLWYQVPLFLTLFLAFLPTTYSNESFYSSKHFDLQSSLALGKARILGKKIEKSYEFLQRMLSSRKSTGNQRPTILILPDQKAFFQQAGQDNTDTTSLGGYFNSNNNRIVTWARPDEAETLDVIVHEMTHLLLKARIPDPPLWLNEGLAEYLSQGTVAFGKLRAGKANAGGHGAAFLQAAGNRTLIPLAQLLSLTKYPEARRDVFYAESWALVFYLWEGEHGKFQKKFRNYVQALADRKDGFTQFRVLFGDPSRFQRKWNKEMKKRAKWGTKSTQSVPNL